MAAVWSGIVKTWWKMAAVMVGKRGRMLGPLVKCGPGSMFPDKPRLFNMMREVVMCE